MTSLSYTLKENAKWVGGGSIMLGQCPPRAVPLAPWSLAQTAYPLLQVIFIRTIQEKKNISRNVEAMFENLFAPLLSAAFMTTVTTATHSFLDLPGSDPAHGYHYTLREEELSNILVLSKMTSTDSAIRESLRPGLPVVTGLWRQVMPKNGVTLLNGQHLKQGVWLAAPLLSIYHDKRYYDRPDAYEPFWFVPKPALEGRCKDEPAIDRKNE
ncbi:hypothetical protein BBP40_004445, partial [Aspergillus hancockii]